MVLDDWITYLSAQVANGPTIAITGISVANPTIVTAVGHGLWTGAQVAVLLSNSTPSINGTRTVTKIDADHVSIAVNVAIAGNTGTLQAGCGTGAVDLFEGELPDAPIVPDLAAVINEYAGAPPEDAFGLADIWRERPRVQVAVRGNVRDYASGRTRIETIYRVMGRVPLPVSVAGVQYYTRRFLSQPTWLKRDDKWRHTHVFSVEFFKDPAA